MRYKSNNIGDGGDAQKVGVSYVSALQRAMNDESYMSPEASLRLPFDEILFDRSRVLSERLVGEKLDYILHIGIGGSNLGARALYEATMGTFDAGVSSAPKMFFADTCEPGFLAGITSMLLSEISEKEEIIIIVASKSGTTTETVVNASVLVSALENKLGSLAERIVCITDEDSALWRIAEEHHYHVLPVPKNVSGRFSVFSPLGMFPLLCLGVDGEALLRGAKMMVRDCVEGEDTSDSFLLAQDIVRWSKKGITLFDFFAFHPELETVGKWYRQLLAESLGKSTAINGEPTAYRIVPSVSIGSTDLHSAEQMYMANPALAARILIRAHAPFGERQLLVKDKIFAPLVSETQNRTPSEIFDAVYRGVIDAYRARGVQFGEVVLDNLDPETLGALLQFFMCATMHLANLLQVNAFDQPDVEVYKKAMRKILSAEAK